MIIHSWNVNGVRAAIKKGFMDYLAEYDPDIVCLQEVKALPEQVDETFEGYHAVWNPADRRGYSGTLILSKQEPISTALGIGKKEHDDEGRVVTAEYETFYLVTVYTPNSKGDLSRLPYRTEEWDVAFLRYVKKLQKQKPVIFCGDLNVAYADIDLSRPKPNRGKSGFTDEERDGFGRMLAAGFVDSFRQLYPETTEAYSWWSFRSGARERNVGWRIDYVMVSASISDGIKRAFILNDVHGSDHCPVGIEWDG